MTRRLYLILLADALLLLALASDGVTARNRPYPDLDAVDRYVERQMAANRVPGLALAITRGDQVVYLKGYGTAENGEPVTPRTQFYTASLSKGFTALAVMQLVEEGKVKLDEPVRTYLPGFATADRRLSGTITVRELLNQTSGLADSGFPAYTLPQPDRIKSGQMIRVDGNAGTVMLLDAASEDGTRRSVAEPPLKASTTSKASTAACVALVVGAVIGVAAWWRNRRQG